MQPSRHLALGTSAADESIMPASSAMLRTNAAAVGATVNEKGKGSARGNRFTTLATAFRRWCWTSSCYKCFDGYITLE